MPAELQPPALATLVDFAERPRVGDWSLRSALVRYAQPEPARVSRLLEQVRRIELALHPQHKVLEKDGPAVWAEAAAASDGPHAALAGLLQATMPIDRVADDLAAWADDRSQPRPDAAIDECVATVEAQLDDLGVPHEEQPPGPPRRGGGERRR